MVTVFIIFFHLSTSLQQQPPAPLSWGHLLPVTTSSFPVTTSFLPDRFLYQLQCDGYGTHATWYFLDPNKEATSSSTFSWATLLPASQHLLDHFLY